MKEVKQHDYCLKENIYFSGRWKGVLKKSVVFSLLHSIFDMFQIGALFLILNGLVEGIKGQDILFAFLLLFAGVIGKSFAVIFRTFLKQELVILCARISAFI